MAATTIYCNPDLGTGSDDGTSEANAYQTVAKALDDGSGGGLDNADPGSILYIKKTSSRHNESSINIYSSGDSTNMTIIEGYETTPGDGGRFECDFFWDLKADNCDYLMIKNIDIERSSYTAGCFRINSGNEQVHIHNCKFYNTNTASANYSAVYCDEGVMFTDCEIISDADSSSITSGAIRLQYTDNLVVSGCVIRAKYGIGAKPYNYRGFVVDNCIFYSAPNRTMEYGIYMDADGGQPVNTCCILNNTFYGCSTSAIEFMDFPNAGDETNILIRGNLFYGDGSSDGVKNADASDTVGAAIISNAFGNMTDSSAGITGWGTNITDIDNVDLTADPFVDVSSGDFRLNGVSGGGASCRSAATPTTYSGLTFASKQDIGAVQHGGLVERISVN